MKNLSAIDEAKDLITKEFGGNTYLRKFTQEVAPKKGVRIKFESHCPVIISASRTNSGGQLVLIGTGYGEHGTTRNRFTEVVSSNTSCFTWSLPNVDTLSRCVEILHNLTSGVATITVLSTGSITFTEIEALTSPAQNNILLSQGNYNSYAPTLTGGGASGTWDINVSGNAKMLSSLGIEGTGGAKKYYKITNLWTSAYGHQCVFLISTRSGENYYVTAGTSDSSVVAPTIIRMANQYSKISSFRYSGKDLYLEVDAYSNSVRVTQVSGDTYDISVTEVTAEQYAAATALTIASNYTSANTNKTTVDWRAASLTLAGALSGATTGAFSTRVSVGYNIGQIDNSRAELSLVTQSNNPCDLWLGSNSARKWSINTRSSTESYNLSIYGMDCGHLVRFTQTGRVGISTTSPEYKLDVNGETRTKGLRIWNASKTVPISVDANGDLHIGGNVYADGYVSAGGKSSTEAGGGIDPDTLWSLLGASTTEKIHVNHLPTSIPAANISGLGTMAFADTGSYLLKNDISTWAKASTKPSYNLTEVLPKSLQSVTTNLNTVADGVYHTFSDGNTQSYITNGPVTNGFVFWSYTHYSSGSDVRKVQLALTRAGHGYIRGCAEGTWGSWNTIYTTGNKPTKSDVGLGNVDNTADANKSVAYANALRDKDHYATTNRIDTANRNFADGGLHYYLATSSMKTGKPSGDGHILHCSWDNGSWEGQMSIPTDASGSVEWRSQNGGTWSAWTALLDANNYNSYAPKKDGTGASGTWGISVSGNAATASSIAWSGVTGKPTSMPASDVYAWAKASSKPSYHAGELGVPPSSYKVTSVAAGIAPYISDVGTNIFSGATTSEITVERSIDDGATWTDVTTAEAANIKNVFSGCVSGNLVISSRSKAVVGDKLRLTFNPSGNTRYCQLSFIYIYFSTNGCGCTCNIEKNLYSDKTKWTAFTSDAPVGGWSGPNIIGMSATIFGQGDTRDSGYGIRMTFRINSVNANYDSRGYIYAIQGFTSNKAWGLPSNNSIAAANRAYSFTDADRAVKFDNAVAINGAFSGATTGSFSSNVTIGGTLSSTGNIGVYQSAGTGTGISLYNGPSYVWNYGLAFATTNSKSKWGTVTGDWATYFTMDGAKTRGWLFKHQDGTFAASLSASGNLQTLGSVTANGVTVSNGTKSVTVSVDSDGNLKFDGNIYATGFVSAGGVSDTTTGGGLDWTELTTQGTQVIHASHIPSLDIAKISNLSSASVSYATSAGSVAWDNVSGKPSLMTTTMAVGNSQLPARLQEYHTSGAANDTTACGFYYLTAGGPFESLHTSNKDFMVIAQGYSTVWGSQIATDFRSNNIAVRNKNNGTWSGWAMMATQSWVEGKGYLTSHQDISGKLDKLTYEYNRELAASANGKIKVVEVSVYDTNITVEVSATTSNIVSGKLVMATQNGRICSSKVYGDYSGTFLSRLYITQTAIVNNRSTIAIYLNLGGWSKTTVSVKIVAPNAAPVAVLSSVSAMPTEGLYTGTSNDLPSIPSWALNSSLAASDVPSLAISKITDLQTSLDGKLSTGGGTMSGSLDVAIDGGAIYFGNQQRVYIGTNDYGDYYIWGTTAADFRIGTNNSERIRVTSTGNVGIGTTTPAAKLDVYSTSALAFKAHYSTGADGAVVAQISQYDTNPYGLLTRIYHTGTVSLQSQRVTTTTEYFGLSLNPLGGNVGIGTTSPSEKLHVDGNIKGSSLILSGDIQMNGEGTIYKLTNTSRRLISAWKTDWSHSAQITYVPDYAAFCFDFGNVGIGTTSPSEKLDVNGTIISRNGIVIRANDNAGTQDIGISGDHIQASLSTVSWSSLLLNPYGGNVGIGTSAPSTKLHVNGRIAVNGPEILNWAAANGLAQTSELSWYGMSKYDCADGTGGWGLRIANFFGMQYCVGGNYQHYFEGQITCSSEITAYSDRRLKSNIKDLTFRGKLTPKSYIKDGKQSIGFIAQEVREKYPELVLGEESKDSYLSLNYGAISAVLSAQLNGVEDEVTTLKKEVATLKAKIKELEER